MTPLILTFVSHFGEMGSRWGFNRTVGQVYALLFVAEHPLHADEIAEHLSFSRSNVSIGLKELQGWGLIRQSRIPGDRREYFPRWAMCGKSSAWWPPSAAAAKWRPP